MGVLANLATRSGRWYPAHSRFILRARPNVWRGPADNPHMFPQRESNGPAPLEALFRADSGRMEYSEDEDEHSAFVMSLSRLAVNLASMSEVARPAATPVRP